MTGGSNTSKVSLIMKKQNNNPMPFLTELIAEPMLGCMGVDMSCAGTGAKGQGGILIWAVW